MSEAEAEVQPIIIVRRKGRGGDGHHGGAWKIAFADFMTAMMALFLVLWLINAANEETKKAVASYFNPVKLVDRNRSEKGINNSDGAVEAETKVEVTHPNAVSGEDQLEEKELTERTEEEMFENPNSVLDEIASKVTADNHTGDVNSEGKGDLGKEEVTDFEDPFAPSFWKSQSEPSVEGTLEELSPGNVGPGVDEQGVEQQIAALMERSALDKDLTDPMTPEKPEETESDPEQALQQELKEQKEKKEKLEELSKEISGEVAEAIREALGTEALFPDSVAVTAAEGGVLISVTEQLNVPMFQIGSAVPRPELVVAMEKIGEVLSQRNGMLQIHGHTDGRRYAGKNYDNWRLSTARAHASYFMLARGGLDKLRVKQISGFADRKLKVANNPNSGANRRIEILLEIQ